MGGEPLDWKVARRTIRCGPATLVMGILNVTPDSFSDGGRYLDPAAAAAHGLAMAAEGADLLDVGGESTRPGAPEVPVEEEIARTVPVVERLAREAGAPISIDTRKPAVAAAALAAGAAIVNDVTGAADPTMFEVVRDAGAGLVLMHMRGTPETMRELTDYRDVVGEVRDHLAARVEAAVSAGVPFECLAVDPGIGFAKDADQSLRLLRELPALAGIGRPIVVGPSRKSFIGHVLGGEAADRVEGTAAAVAWAAARGAHVVRVHDVRHMARVARMTDAIAGAGAAAALAPGARR